jgi:hypothetical protein
MWKIEPKDKFIHKYKHDHMYIYRKSMFTIVGLFKGTVGEGRGKENDNEHY